MALTKLFDLATPAAIADAVALIEGIQPDIEATMSWGKHAEANTVKVSEDAAAAAGSASTAATKAADAETARAAAVAAKNAAQAVGASTDAQLAAIDANPASVTRAQQDAREAAAQEKNKAATGNVYATDFGCTFDGVTDDTAAFQAFMVYIATNARVGVLPKGTAKLTAKIDIPRRFGWQLRGAGREATVLKQHTDNTPILDIGAYPGGPQVHSFGLYDLRFDYLNFQPATNTLANPIVFSKEAYWGTMERLTFVRGSWAFRVAAGIGGPWGCSWNDLTFGGDLSGGAMDWSLCINAVPNNHFGRLFVDGSNMVGPVFDIRGYNFTIDTIEFAAMTLGAKLLNLAANSRVDIGSLKLENGVYNTANKQLISLQGSAYAKIGHLTVGGHSMIVNVPGGAIYLLSVNEGNGAGGYLNCDYLDLSLSSLTGKAYVSSPGTASAGIELGYRLFDANWVLVNSSSSTHAERTLVRQFVSGHVSADKGDADYAIGLGDPNVVMFRTPLTAQRTVALPSSADLIPNGVYYDIVSVGAVSTTNPLIVKHGAVTVATLTVPASRTRFIFGRVASGVLNTWTALP